MRIERLGLQNAVPLDSQSTKKEQEIKTVGQEQKEVNRTDLNISQMSKEEMKNLPVSEQFLIKSIEKANRAVLGLNTRFEFSIHDKTKEMGNQLLKKLRNKLKNAGKAPVAFREYQKEMSGAIFINRQG